MRDIYVAIVVVEILLWRFFFFFDKIWEKDQVDCFHVTSIQTGYFIIFAYEWKILKTNKFNLYELKL